MKASLIDQKRALQYVCQNEHGLVAVFEEEFGYELVREFESVGFIRRGITPEVKDTWSKTSYADSFLKSFYGRPSLRGCFYYHAPRV